MTPLPPPLGSGEIRFWRLDAARHASTWDSGEGAFLGGGRWNPKGLRMVYAALDPATALVEVAVHKGFAALDSVPHVLTSARIPDPTSIHAVTPGDLPFPDWLLPGLPAAAQQAHGKALTEAHPFVLLPSTVSRQSWNLIFRAPGAQGGYDDIRQEPFVLDPRLKSGR